MAGEAIVTPSRSLHRLKFYPDYFHANKKKWYSISSTHRQRHRNTMNILIVCVSKRVKIMCVKIHCSVSVVAIMQLHNTINRTPIIGVLGDHFIGLALT